MSICLRTIGIENIDYNGEKRVLLKFDYDLELIELVKELPNRKWSNQLKIWHIPFSDNYIEILNTHFKDVAKIISTEKSSHKANDIHYGSVGVTIPDDYIKTLEVYRYSEPTCKTYIANFKRFLSFYPNIAPENIDKKQIKEYLHYLVTKRKISASAQNQAINSIKFYYEKVLKRKREVYDLERPRLRKQLPQVLSEEEVVKILKTIKNLKHKSIIYLIYSAGLRLGEVVWLKISDIDSDRMQIFIRSAKGNKDRYVILSETVLNLLREYFKQYRPKDWLFEGQKGGQYSKKSVQNIFKRALNDSSVKKWASVHTLRHSFATHLLEKGTDLRYIQQILGHKNVKTTERYTHITKTAFNNIKSPIDTLNLEDDE